jgi:fructokinase
MGHDEIFANLHSFGASLVCLTLGNKGAKLSENGKPILELSALKVDKIMDATGAGDAFWSGFLFSWIKGKTNQNSMETALKMAAIKLQNVGRIPDYALLISNVLNN